MTQELMGHINTRDQEDLIIAGALEILARRLQRGTQLLTPHDVREFLVVKLAGEVRENFFAIWLDNNHRIIRMETIAQGGLRDTSIHAREVIRSALENNAAAVIIAHNHPSGVTTPSDADKELTRNLMTALKLVDVTLLDHFIVAGGGSLSFAEQGLL